ncbi:threonine/serine exporter family protein [Paenibacillus sp. chi10]|uniref:Threonine/serine exporter family protein n=1 Tax=Paenibacillus suaedae TaxID=3077233 RepID=A0AAJ2K208_9BACL|nr:MULTISPECIES: threonine/serine exporter family protein [unclassified Paenibacillus]MDT8979115.1 threonine/serine exporter family protein [Paenibacillus sp. chi10]GAV13425.1 integral membrane protein [Paenibacillus sp. NAIST15-1]
MNIGSLARDKDYLLETVLFAGKLLLENGAETSRVEDTMERMIRHAIGDSRPTSDYTYVTVNGIFVKLNSGGSQFQRIDKRQYDLNKICGINQISRDFAAGRISLQDMRHRLFAIERDVCKLKLWHKFICTACLSGSIILLFGGSFVDVPAAIFAGLVAYFMHSWLTRALHAPFLPEYGAALLGGVAGYIAFTYRGVHLDLIMMGAVAPLVPGIAITNAIRDMMARHYISGMIVAIEALFTASALGAGIASAYYLFFGK